MLMEILALDVMDYSLIVGVDATKGELVVGIVGKLAPSTAIIPTEANSDFADFIRTYTWDKKVENWVKDSVLGGESHLLNALMCKED